MPLSAGEYKELSEKLNQMNIDMTRQIGQIQTEFSSTMGELRGTLGQLVSKLETMDSMKKDLQEVRDKTRDAYESTKSSHKRLDRLEKELSPIKEANPVERIAKLETDRRWTLTTLILFVLGIISFYIQYLIKGGQ